jgi:hypothetical protein
LSGRGAWLSLTVLAAAGARLAAQEPGELPRRPPAQETGCDSSAAGSGEPEYVVDSVDRPVQARRLPIEGMPVRIREVTSGRSVFRFVVETSGRIDRCSIEVVEETSRAWSEAVLKELRVARYDPARRGGRPVRQLVHQVFVYHSDGRLERPR